MQKDITSPTLRCAIYTRKSNAEGLDQEYNSIDAQKEAGHAYITAHRAKGWVAVADDYDDPAYSGSNTDRPALQALMTDIRSNKIDVVIIYKIDRLSRSIYDFLQLMSVFEQHNVSFVSITQEFNTTTSMGRLMLNILLSFAQFEREVTTERIRDKIAASKQKGLWMGGIPPLGYDVDDRKLVINPQEANTVQTIFHRFTEIQSMTLLAKECQLEGMTTKSWTTQQGHYKAGKPISTAFLYKLLNNRTYLGELSHHEKWYNGQHDAIIDPDVWERVHAIFKTNRHDRAGHTRSTVPFLLKGLVFDQEGYALTTWSTTKKKNGRRYRYYISSKDAKGYQGASELPRFQASELEKTITAPLLTLLGSPQILDAMAHQSEELNEAEICIAMKQVSTLWDTLFPDEQARIVALLVQRIIVTKNNIEIQLHNNGIETLGLELATASDKVSSDAPKQLNHQGTVDQQSIIANNSDGSKSVIIPYQVRKRSDKKRIVSPATPPSEQADMTPLQIALARGFKWESMLTKGEASSIKAIADKVGVDNSYVSRMVNLTTLAPDIITAILDETLPDTITLEKLAIGTPVLWEEQREKMAILI